MAKYKPGEGFAGLKPLRILVSSITKGEGIAFVRKITLRDGRAVSADQRSTRSDAKWRAKLLQLIEQLPEEKLPTALDMLNSLMAPTPADRTLVPATDEEFRAVAQRVIAKYKPALERLAKR